MIFLLNECGKNGTVGIVVADSIEEAAKKLGLNIVVTDRSGVACVRKVKTRRRKYDPYAPMFGRIGRDSVQEYTHTLSPARMLESAKDIR